MGFVPSSSCRYHVRPAPSCRHLELSSGNESWLISEIDFFKNANKHSEADIDPEACWQTKDGETEGSMRMMELLVPQ